MLSRRRSTTIIECSREFSQLGEGYRGCGLLLSSKGVYLESLLVVGWGRSLPRSANMPR